MTKRASFIIPVILLAARFSACNGSTPGVKEGAPNKTLWIFRYYEYNTEYLQLSKDVKELLAEEFRSHKFAVQYPKKQDLVGIPYYAAPLAMKIEQIACPNCHNIKDGTPATGLGLKQVALAAHSMDGLISHFAIQYNLFGAAEKQRILLEEEGVVFVKDKVDFKKLIMQDHNNQAISSKAKLTVLYFRQDYFQLLSLIWRFLWIFILQPSMPITLFPSSALLWRETGWSKKK